MQHIKNIKRRLPLIAIITLSVVLYHFYGNQISLENLQNNKEMLFEYKNNMPYLSALMFACFYALSTFMSLPFGTLFAILGGYLFGAFYGLFVVTVGATIGASVLFIVSRYSLKGVVPKKMDKIYNKVKNNFEENEVSYLFFLRLVPLFPFAVVNILPALFNVPLRVYIFTTFFGIIPGTFAHTYLGSAFEEINSLSGLVSAKTLSAFALLSLLSLIPVGINYYKKKRKIKT